MILDKGTFDKFVKTEIPKDKWKYTATVNTIMKSIFNVFVSSHSLQK